MDYMFMQKYLGVIKNGVKKRRFFRQTCFMRFVFRAVCAKNIEMKLTGKTAVVTGGTKRHRSRALPTFFASGSKYGLSCAQLRRGRKKRDFLHPVRRLRRGGGGKRLPRNRGKIRRSGFFDKQCGHGHFRLGGKNVGARFRQHFGRQFQGHVQLHTLRSAAASAKQGQARQRVQRGGGDCHTLSGVLLRDKSGGSQSFGRAQKRGAPLRRKGACRPARRRENLLHRVEKKKMPTRAFMPHTRRIRLRLWKRTSSRGMSAAYPKKNLCLRRQKKYAARQGHRREIQIFVFCGRHFAEAAQRLAAVQNLRRRELKLLTIHENSANILGIKDF